MKKIITLLLLICTQAISIGQHHGGHNNKGSNKSMENGEIYGVVLDDISRNPISYATVSLIDDDKLITGTITDAKGKYELTHIAHGDYRIKISFIGYSDIVIDDIIISRQKATYQVPDILLKSNVILDEVVIDGTSPTITYEIDKKVIDVSKMNSDLGQSAIEILENIPSVTLDNDGMINLRGSSSFTLLIDGKPTTLDASEALNTIPASTIKNIEIITNPSAKYDAEGVSGIINIVLKQNKLQGASMLVNLNVGNFGAYGGDIATSYKVKKHGFNVSGNYNIMPRLGEVTSERTRNINQTISVIKGSEDSKRLMKMAKVKGEYIYEPNSAHTLIIGGVLRQFFMDNFSDTKYETLIDGNKIGATYLNDEDAIRHFKTGSVNMTYQYHIGRDKNHYLAFNAIYSEWNGDELILSDYITDGVKTGGTKRTETGPTKASRFNIDYHKKNEDHKFETGVQVQIGRSGDDSDSYTYNAVTDQYDYLSLYSKDVSYDRDVLAAYTMYGGKWNGLGYQLGIRVEHTFRNIEANGIFFDPIKRLDWFPSLHLSYTLPNDHQLMMNYSRRIQRPRSYHFEPFITWNSVYEVSSGNPNLQPEYIDSYELNWNKSIGKVGNIGIELYHRFTTNQIQRTKTVYKDDILLKSPINIGEAMATGLSLSSSYKIKKWWKTDLSINLYRYKISGHLLDQDYNRSSNNWTSRWSNNFPLKNDWTLQLAANYTSPTATVQGHQEQYFTMSTSIKKSFWKRRFALNLQGRNILSTMKRETYFTSGNLSVHSIRIPKSPSIVLTGSLRLNNYKTRRRKDSVDDI